MATIESKVAPKIKKLLNEAGLEIMLRTIITELEPQMKDPAYWPTLCQLRYAYDLYMNRGRIGGFDLISTNNAPTKSVVDRDLEELMTVRKK